MPPLFTRCRRLVVFAALATLWLPLDITVKNVNQPPVADAGASSADEVVVTVTNANQVPLADAGDDQTVDEETAVTLDGSASRDPDADALSYAWTQVGGPPAVL
jgi:hypothetical protein